MKTLIVLCAAALLPGCIATVTKTDGTRIAGKIRGSDPVALDFLRSSSCSPAFKACAEAAFRNYDSCRKMHCNLSLALRIPRSEIREISHPGTTTVWTGLALLVAGAAAIVGAFFAPESCYSADDCSNMNTALPLLIFGAAGATTGLGMVIGGLISWRSSVARAR